MRSFHAAFAILTICLFLRANSYKFRLFPFREKKVTVPADRETGRGLTFGDNGRLIWGPSSEWVGYRGWRTRDVLDRGDPHSLLPPRRYVDLERISPTQCRVTEPIDRLPDIRRREKVVVVICGAESSS